MAYQRISDRPRFSRILWREPLDQYREILHLNCGHSQASAKSRIARNRRCICVICHPD